MYLPLDIPELDDGQHDHDGHQYHRLGSRTAEIKAQEAVMEDLVDQDVGRPRGTALR